MDTFDPTDFGELDYKVPAHRLVSGHNELDSANLAIKTLRQNTGPQVGPASIGAWNEGSVQNDP